MPPRLPAPGPFSRTHITHRPLSRAASSTIPAKRKPHRQTLPQTAKPARLLRALQPASTTTGPNQPSVPPYPYAQPTHFKQSLSGLYGSQTIQFGNNVSEKNEIKTRRSWHPNIKRKWLYSEALGRKVRVKLSTRVLKTIDKVGGLDAYLTTGGPTRVKELGPYGWAMRWVVLTAMAEKGGLSGVLKREFERDGELVREMGEVRRGLEETWGRDEDVMDEADKDEEEEEEEGLTMSEDELKQIPTPNSMLEQPDPGPAEEEKGMVRRWTDTVMRPFRNKY